MQLADVTEDNWRDVAAVTPTASQQEFVTATTYYMCLANYGDDWNSLAVVEGDTVVGHVMWAVDHDEGSVWMGGLVIDAEHQSRGIGRAAVEAFLNRFATGLSPHVALSYSPDNDRARRLYMRLGFRETGEIEDDEIVARYRL